MALRKYGSRIEGLLLVSHLKLPLLARAEDAGVVLAVIFTPLDLYYLVNLALRQQISQTEAHFLYDAPFVNVPYALSTANRGVSKRRTWNFGARELKE